jgi:hypothetical protein
MIKFFEDLFEQLIYGMMDAGMLIIPFIASILMIELYQKNYGDEWKDTDLIKAIIGLFLAMIILRFVYVIYIQQFVPLEMHGSFILDFFNDHKPLR